MGFNNTLNDWQSETRSAWTRGVERVNGASQNLFIHTVSMVNDINSNEARALNLFPAYGNFYRSAFRHSLKCVGDEIVKYESQEVGIRLNNPQVRILRDFDRQDVAVVKPTLNPSNQLNNRYATALDDDRSCEAKQIGNEAIQSCRFLVKYAK